MDSHGTSPSRSGPVRRRRHNTSVRNIAPYSQLSRFSQRHSNVLSDDSFNTDIVRSESMTNVDTVDSALSPTRDYSRHDSVPVVSNAESGAVSNSFASADCDDNATDSTHEIEPSSTVLESEQGAVGGSDSQSHSSPASHEQQHSRHHHEHSERSRRRARVESHSLWSENVLNEDIEATELQTMATSLSNFADDVEQYLVDNFVTNPEDVATQLKEGVKHLRRYLESRNNDKHLVRGILKSQAVFKKILRIFFSVIEATEDEESEGGMPAIEISYLPVTKFEKQKEDVNCRICLVDLEDGDKCRNLKCGHQMHMDCMDNWLKS